MEIRELRIKKNLTQAELAEKVGISQQHLSKIESHLIVPKYSTLEKILNVLGYKITFKKEDTYDRHPS